MRGQRPFGPWAFDAIVHSRAEVHTHRYDRDKEAAGQKWSGKAARDGLWEAAERRVKRSVCKTRQGSVTDSKAEGKTGAPKVRGVSFTRSLECRAERRVWSCG